MPRFGKGKPMGVQARAVLKGVWDLSSRHADALLPAIDKKIKEITSMSCASRDPNFMLFPKCIFETQYKRVDSSCR